MEIAIFGKQLFINKVLLFCVIIFLIICSGVLGYFLKQVYQPLSSSEILESSTKIIQSKAAEPSNELTRPAEETAIKIYVIGCVNKPGVVEIKKGQVIDDAIRIAGGATKDADLENINLAYKLSENTMLRIKSKAITVAAVPSTKASPTKSVTTKPTINSNPNKSQQQNNTMTNANNSIVANTSKMNSGVDIVTDSLGAIVEEDESKDSNKESSLININKASQAELENLPNVGPATAKAIISYREKNGGFKMLTDIMKITGIKQKTYDKIKEFICIE